MDVIVSEWNDKRIMVRMLVGYIWKGPSCLVYNGYINHIHGIGINYCNITYYMYMYSIQTRHTPCFVDFRMLLICLKVEKEE